MGKYNLDNTHLIKLMNNLKEEYSPENQMNLLEAMFKAEVLVPTYPQTVEDRILPIPIAVTTSDGQLFQPVFTDEDHIDSRITEDLDITKMPFVQLAVVVLRQNETYKKQGEDMKPVNGIVINPETQAIVFPTGLIAKKIADMNIAKLNDEEYAVFARCKYEQHYLPSLFFEKGEEFVKMLLDKKEKFIVDMCKAAYADGRTFPYTTEDFSVHAIKVDNAKIVAKVDMPEKYKVAGTSEAALMVAYNGSDEKRFFTIMLEPVEGGLKRMMVEILANKKALVIGEAPAEGTDIAWLLDFVK